MPVVTEHYTNGLGNSAVYALFSDDDDTAVQMTEGSGLKAGIYTASDSAIQSAGLSAGTYRVSVRRGDYSSPSASDYEAFSVPRFTWDGTNEVDELGDLTAGNTYGPFLNRKPDVTVEVQPTRADGYTTKRRVPLLAGATSLVALEYPNPNEWLYNMTLPISPDTDTLTVDSNAYGVNRNLAMVEVTIASGAASGAEITLPVDVQPTQGTTDKRLVLFEVIAPTQ